ncbi:MAG: menaquinone biosynthetic enzyme MqnA/MqnD family protein [Planctomycetota bacterium]|jgi:chorismate dehydratase
MVGQDAPTLPARTRRPIRLGVVSFVNTLPLIDGLENLVDLDLRFTVPSLLLDQLVGGEVDLALCSSIDYQRSDAPLTIVPVGLLGCDGSTLTVRLYSTRPLDQISEVYCDTDSHTSVVLMQILLKEQYRIEPRLIDYDARERVADNRPLDWPQAVLLIGDKVVTDSPPAIRYPYQLDLGAAWAELTGLPFVFALWLARRECNPSIVAAAAAILDRQRRHNRERLDLIIHRRALSRGWPPDLADGYLKQEIAFEWSEQRRAGLELFFDKACEHGLANHRRPLELTGF